MGKIRKASTSAWGMISSLQRRMRCALPLLWGVLLLAGRAGAEGTTEEFVGSQFDGAPPPMKVITVTGEVSRVCASVTGRPYVRKEIQYWQRDETTVWILATRGKHGVITAGFRVVGGVIQDSRVLDHREMRGRGIESRRFLKQFRGVRLDPKGQLDRRIDGITGATISLNAMKALAALALTLDAALS